MNDELIKTINDKCPYEQGIFTEPYGIPVHIKEPVIYSRYDRGGVTGGSCWDTETHRYTEDVPTDHMKVLDILLEEIAPKISYLQYRKIQAITHTKEDTTYEYYGNSTDYLVEYIILSDLEKLLEQL